jgi:hypothetical protein
MKVNQYSDYETKKAFSHVWPPFPSHLCHLILGEIPNDTFQNVYQVFVRVTFVDFTITELIDDSFLFLYSYANHLDAKMKLRKAFNDLFQNGQQTFTRQGVIHVRDHDFTTRATQPVIDFVVFHISTFSMYAFSLMIAALAIDCSFGMSNPSLNFKIKTRSSLAENLHLTGVGPLIKTNHFPFAFAQHTPSSD